MEGYDPSRAATSELRTRLLPWQYGVGRKAGAETLHHAILWGGPVLLSLDLRNAFN